MLHGARSRDKLSQHHWCTGSTALVPAKLDYFSLSREAILRLFRSCLLLLVVYIFVVCDFKLFVFMEESPKPRWRLVGTHEEINKSTQVKRCCSLLYLLQKTLTICVLAFFFSASPCFLLTTSSSFFSSQFSIVSINRKHHLRWLKTILQSHLLLWLSSTLRLDRLKRATPTFLQLFVSFVHVDASLLTFPLHRQVVAELALVAFGALALLEERTQHRLRVDSCRKGTRSYVK